MNTPMFTTLENATLAIAILVFGIMAGFFWTYTFNVNLAMLQVDGSTYAEVQSLFNQNVRHLMFFVFFFGGGLFSLLAVIANLRHRKTLPFLLLTLAGIIYITGVILFTQQANLPLNSITESWIPTQLPNDWTDIRDQWNQANTIRVYTSFSAFVLSITALMLRANQSGR